MFVSMITFLIPIAIVGVWSLLIVVNHRRAARRIVEAAAGYEADNLARRLGLVLVEGDPTFNLMNRGSNREFLRGARLFRPVDLRLRMAGAIDDVAVELRYHFAQKKSISLVSVTYQTAQDCRITARPARPFPPFEVISRQTTRGPIVGKTGVAQMATGRPDVDAALAVATLEPAMAQLLGEMMGWFAPVAAAGVHLVGDGQEIAFLLHADGPPTIEDVLPHAPSIVAAVAKLARKVGG